jgi:hypothetical protein
VTTKAHETVSAAVAAVVDAATVLDEASLDFESTTVEEAADSLGQLSDAIMSLRQLQALLERWVAECFRAEGWKANEPREIPGVGVVEVRRSRNRRAWQHEQLRSAWLNEYLSRNGGEAPDPFTVVADFLKVASINGWKVTGLREYGLEADDWCDSEPGTPTVQVRRVEEDETADVVELPARQDGAA